MKLYDLVKLIVFITMLSLLTTGMVLRYCYHIKIAPNFHQK